MSVVRAAKLAADQVRTLLPQTPPDSVTLLHDWFAQERATQSKPQDRNCII